MVSEISSSLSIGIRRGKLGGLRPHELTMSNRGFKKEMLSALRARTTGLKVGTQG